MRGDRVGGEATTQSIQDLLLDPRNPRIPPADHLRTQDELLLLLARDYSLLEIGESIAQNNFFQEEPLAGAFDGREEPPYTVVEGNRRLAALKLLTSELARDLLRAERQAQASEWDQLAEAAPEILEVPVVMYAQRDELLTFMGYRHITGVRPWRPLAKARFTHALIEEEGMDFRDAAQTIGSKPAYVRQAYLAHRVYLQAKVAGIDVTNLEGAYSVFARGLQNTQLRRFIGITSVLDRSMEPNELREPVPAESIDKLGELISWISGDEHHAAVTQDSRQVDELGLVVAVEEACALLRRTRDLSQALTLTSAPEQRVIEGLQVALESLSGALRDITPLTATAQVSDMVSRLVVLSEEVRRAVDDAAEAE
ncbi:MAG: hypothetical protein FD171_52 [Actinobacteria bacterium]|nr:MAG: hypothetical protein FD171_52 [Actinomycetota bacterium]